MPFDSCSTNSEWSEASCGGCHTTVEVHLQASVPLSEMFQYVSNLRGMTKGRAQYSMQLEKYDVVPPQVRTSVHFWAWGNSVATHELCACRLSTSLRERCAGLA